MLKLRTAQLKHGTLNMASRAWHPEECAAPGTAAAIPAAFVGGAARRYHPSTMLNVVNLTSAAALQMAVQHQQAGHLPQAAAVCRQILTQEPNNPEALHLLGILTQQTGDAQTALDLISRAIALAPRVATFHYNLGNVLVSRGQIDQAADAFRTAVSLQPDFAQAYNRLSWATMTQGRIEAGIQYARQALALQPDINEAAHRMLLFLHCLPQSTPQTLYDEHRRWAQQFAEPLRQFIQPHPNERTPNRRLRIGYVSQDFRQQPVGLLMMPLLSSHDRRNFEVFCYAHAPYHDIVTRELRARTDVWRDIAGLTDEQAAAQIRADRIDILIDMSMHSIETRLLIFARKPAPVQVTYLAYCSTTGLDTIDYRITDPHLDPPGADEACYSERSFRLPETYWYYKPAIETPPVNALPARVPGEVTFACLNNFCKVSPQNLVDWCRLLRELPRSRLILHTRQNASSEDVRSVLAREAIDPQRVTFSPYVPLYQCFELYHKIDIALDPYPWCGGLTTCDALWMGVPVVTLAGQTCVSRGGLSILSNIGLPELATHNLEEYLATAIALANDLPCLAQLRATLRQRMADSPLMNVQRFVGNLEAAYRQMWQTWCASPQNP